MHFIFDYSLSVYLIDLCLFRIAKPAKETDVHEVGIAS